MNAYANDCARVRAACICIHVCMYMSKHMHATKRCAELNNALFGSSIPDMLVCIYMYISTRWHSSSIIIFYLIIATVCSY